MGAGGSCVLWKVLWMRVEILFERCSGGVGDASGVTRLAIHIHNVPSDKKVVLRKRTYERAPSVEFERNPCSPSRRDLCVVVVVEAWVLSLLISVCSCEC